MEEGNCLSTLTSKFILSLESDSSGSQYILEISKLHEGVAKMPKFHILSAAKYSFISSWHVPYCSMINKNPETEPFRFNLKVRKAKQPATSSYLYLIPKWWSYFQEFQNETVWELSPPVLYTVWELSPPILYSSLVLGLKAYTTTAQFLL